MGHDMGSFSTLDLLNNKNKINTVTYIAFFKNVDIFGQEQYFCSHN